MLTRNMLRLFQFSIWLRSILIKYNIMLRLRFETAHVGRQFWIKYFTAYIPHNEASLIHSRVTDNKTFCEVCLKTSIFSIQNHKGVQIANIVKLMVTSWHCTSFVVGRPHVQFLMISLLWIQDLISFLFLKNSIHYRWTRIIAMILNPCLLQR